MKKVLCTLGVVVALLLAFPCMGRAQQWGLTANGLYWATATLNVGVEYAFSSKMSAAGLIQYNPSTHAKNREMKHLVGQVEYRCWLSEVFRGHHLGVHATGGIFNFGNPPFGILKDCRFESQLYGGGLTYGYQWITSSRVNIGVDIGLGYLQVNYDKFYCPTCGERVDHYRTGYVGPTKISVSIIYLLKQGRGQDMNIRQAFFISFSFFISLSVLAADRSTQSVRTEVYRLERRDSVLLVDLVVDLTSAHLAPDCTVYLSSLLSSGNTADSLLLSPIVLNGSQSDPMYRQRRALGITSGLEKVPSYTVLRKGDHALPYIHYRIEVSCAARMEDVKVRTWDTSCNCDARLVPFAMQTERIPSLIVERVDTIVICDTVRVVPDIPEQLPVVVNASSHRKVVPIQAGYEADIYFPTNEMRILPDHKLNHASWMHFVGQVDSIERDNRNSISGVTVTGYSSPKGYALNNERLAEKRAKALQELLENKYGERMKIAVEQVDEDRGQFEKDIELSDLPEHDEILSILRTVKDNNQRKKSLKTLDKGKIFGILLREYFPKLRRVSCRVRYVK